MTRPARRIPEVNDPLGEVLHLLEPTGTIYSRTEMYAPWGVGIPPLDGCMMFHIVTVGRCWLEIDGECTALREGSLVLVPHGEGHSLRSAPEERCVPLFDIPVEHISEQYEVLRHGESGDYTQTLCVVVRFDSAASRSLIDLLPKVLHMDTWGSEDGRWLSATLQLLSYEAQARRAGGETIITRLADVLVVQMLRSWLNSTAHSDGWLAALRDPHLGKAIAAVHRTPASPWTVEALAREAGMSRSAFSARFTTMVGQSAMNYVTWWRMNLARTRLRRTGDALVEVAERVGYVSEASFSRAFKRTFGVSPGSYRKANAQG